MAFHRLLPAVAIALSLAAMPAMAAPQEQPQARAGGTSGGVLGLLPQDAVSQHVLTADGRSIPYTATAGTLDLFDQDGARTAKMFYTAYVAKDQAAGDQRPARPITFVFNGGPGAASAYLNLGLVGPRIVDFGTSGRDGADAKLIDNPQSWLRFTDLVLIDPIGTGWSRTTKPDDAKDFYSVEADSQAMAKAIALYIAHNGRAGSPKYILGESYGGFRAAKVATGLRQDQGILVSGVLMLSPLIDAQLVFGADRYPLGAALQIPSLAAAAMERRNAFTEQGVRDAETFAIRDYLPTLAGAPPSGSAATAFYDRISRITGIPTDIVAKSQGFVGRSYYKHSDGDGADIVSPYDGSFLAPDPYPGSENERGDDPILDGFTRAYGSAFANYARTELGFHTDITYELLSTDVNRQWNWGGRHGGSRLTANATDDIKETLSVNPAFRLMVAQGYSDLLIPFGVNKYVLDHLPPAFADRVALKVYHGGHMFYTRSASRAQFTADAEAFYGTQPAPEQDKAKPGVQSN
jgi:carboxypeptidase C (cathepsin A)